MSLHNTIFEKHWQVEKSARIINSISIVAQIEYSRM
jgi:hypothetical protein